MTCLYEVSGLQNVSIPNKNKLKKLLQVIGSRASEMGTEENERNDLYDKENNKRRCNKHDKKW